MTELLTAAQMRAIEAAAIDSGAVTGLELMERAGAGVVKAIFEEWPDLANGQRRAVVLCGPGNNGGDGFVVARLLHDRGWAVDVFLYGHADKLPPDAKANHARWASIGQTCPLGSQNWDALPVEDADLVIDALFGTGLVRPVDLPLARVSTATGNSRWRVVAVDVPSGLCSDSGRCLDGENGGGGAVHADLTVTFHTGKPGHYLAEGPAYAGALAVVGIGLDPVSAGANIATLTDGPPADLHKHSAHKSAHKYAHGHALVLAGGVGRGGAGRLAARGALRIGAGLVTLGCAPSAIAENAAQLNAIMLAPLADGYALSGFLRDDRINALGLGPGLGVGTGTQDLVRAALGAKRPTVLDADALTSFAEVPETLLRQLHPNCILTPHGGEFARLFPEIAAKLDAPATTGPAYSKLDAAREAAALAGCTVLLKGADTVIAAPDGTASIHAAHYDRAAPWLATAGAGDVLAGFIAGLLARGFAPFDAGCAAAWLHVECARSFGPGLIAEDLPEDLPKVFRALRP